MGKEQMFFHLIYAESHVASSQLHCSCPYISHSAIESITTQLFGWISCESVDRQLSDRAGDSLCIVDTNHLHCHGSGLL